jgi:hypothetical protein
MKSLILFIALWSGLLAPASVRAQEVHTIYDGSLELKTTKLSDAENALIKEKVFPAARNEWHDQEADGVCAEGFSPEAIDVARGSFTKPNSDQKAILYRYCETGHNFALNGIAVIENDRVVSHLVYEGARDNAIRALPDIDGNGRSEILIGSGGTNQGVTWETVTMIELSDTTALTKFGHTEVLSDDCGFDEKKGSATAYRLSVKPGAKPVFYREAFVDKGACNGTGGWKQSGALQRISLEKDEIDYQFIGSITESGSTTSPQSWIESTASAPDDIQQPGAEKAKRDVPSDDSQPTSSSDEIRETSGTPQRTQPEGASQNIVPDVNKR